MTRLLSLVTLFGLVGLLAACGVPGLAQPTSTPPPTATPAPTSTPLPPTATATAVRATPTATAAPSATRAPAGATVAPTRGAAATATATATPSAAGGAPGAATDQTGACRAPLPAGFQALGSGLWYADDALLLLAAADTGGKDFAAFTATIPDQLAADSSLKGFKPGKVTQQPDRYRLDFTADATGNDPNPATGVVAAVPGGGATVCVLEFFYHPDQQARYGSVADDLVAGLQAVKR